MRTLPNETFHSLTKLKHADCTLRKYAFHKSSNVYERNVDIGYFQKASLSRRVLSPVKSDTFYL